MPDRFPWKSYTRRTSGHVKAFRNDGPRSVMVRGDVGPAIPVPPGEWAVTSAGREARALTDEVFQQLYQIAEE